MLRSPLEHVSEHFLWKDVLFLPSWSRLADESDGLTDQICRNISFLMTKIELVRAFLGGKPIMVHVCYRSAAYNKLVKGANNSAHMALAAGVAAIDFHVVGMTCDEVRTALLPKLEEFGLRMEDLPGSGWVHLDCRPLLPGGKRFFIP